MFANEKLPCSTISTIYKSLPIRTEGKTTKSWNIYTLNLVKAKSYFPYYPTIRANKLKFKYRWLRSWNLAIKKISTNAIKLHQLQLAVRSTLLIILNPTIQTRISNIRTQIYTLNLEKCIKLYKILANTSQWFRVQILPANIELRMNKELKADNLEMEYVEQSKNTKTKGEHCCFRQRRRWRWRSRKKELTWRRTRGRRRVWRGFFVSL